MNLLNALKQLDPNNNDHWTTDGSPRLDIVKTLMGDDGIDLKRQGLINEFPEFSRSNILLPESPKALETDDLKKSDLDKSLDIIDPKESTKPDQEPGPSVEHVQLSDNFNFESEESKLNSEVSRQRKIISDANEEIYNLTDQLNDLKARKARQGREDPIRAYLQAMVGNRNKATE